MASLFRNGVSVNNTSQFSYSGWFRIPSIGNPATFTQCLFSWAVDDGLQELNRISITKSVGDRTLDFWIWGHTRPKDGGAGDYWPGMHIQANSSNLFEFDTWYSMQFSQDQTLTDTHGGGLPANNYDLIKRTNQTCILNGVNLLGKPLQANSNSVGYYGGGAGGASFNSIGAGVNWLYDCNNGYVGPAIADYTPAPWDILINGAYTAIPLISNSYYLAGTDSCIVEYAYTQVWFGTYIDWTNQSNFSKVVKVTGGIGAPESTNISASAFGVQTFLFEGDNNSFYINRGTGGLFTKTGTIKNFTPAASYVVGP